MTSRPRVFASITVFLLALLSSTAFPAEAPHTLTFAELTYGNRINALVPDGRGGVWFGGSSCSTALPTTANAVQRTSASGCHGMLGRMTGDGAITYLTYLGGTRGWDEILALAVDAAGNVYAGGWTSSSDFPTTDGAYDRVCGNDGTCTIFRYSGAAGRKMLLPASDGFVTEVAAAGDRILYSTYAGGTDSDTVRALAVDALGRIHVTGDTISTDFPVTAGALQAAWSPDYDPDGDPLTDAFYARIGGDRTSIAFGTYLGGNGSDWGTGVALDAQGDTFVTGNTAARNFPVRNAPQPTNTSTTQYPHTSTDGFLVRIGAAGAIYSTYVGGSESDYANGIAAVGGSVYLAGEVCSSDFPGVSDPNVTQCAAYIAEAAAATGAVIRTVTLHNTGGWDRVNALAVDANRVAYIAGITVSIRTPAFPTTPDAYQRSSTFDAANGNTDAFLSIVDMGDDVPSLQYSTYLGSANEEQAFAVASDGTGGAFVAGTSRVLSGQTPSFPSHTSQPQPPRETTDGSQPFVAHVTAAPVSSGGGGSEIVLDARDASLAGAWTLVADATAAGQTRVFLPDAGVPKLSAAAASPSNYFELNFDAQAGVPYHLWLRMKADADSWQNDSVFVQFTDAVDGNGNAVWRIGTTSATVVSLEDCSGCGEQGWGWNDNGYATSGSAVMFATSGRHTLRVQQREDGISIDQIVLSSRAYLESPPGANKNDTTILNRHEIVLYAGDTSSSAGSWQIVADVAAAGGRRLWNPDAGQAKLTTAAAAPASYFEMTFNAQAGVPYHVWLRMKADADSWQNDSVFVQFSDSADGNGNPIWRTGSTSAAVVSLEDCNGCGEQGWGWNDNGYGTPGPLVMFATSGPHTIRVQQREDGISIDQIVLSAVAFLNQPPGAAKNDTTIVPK